MPISRSSPPLISSTSHVHSFLFQFPVLGQCETYLYSVTAVSLETLPYYYPIGLPLSGWCVCVCVCVCARACVLSCVWLFCDPMACSLSGSSVHGILQARSHFLIQGIFPTQGSNWRVDSLPLSHLGRPCVHAKSLQLHLTLCNPMDCNPPGSSVHWFSRQEYWSGLPCSAPWDLPNPWIELTSLAAPALQILYLWPTGEALGSPFQVVKISFNLIPF